MCDSMMSPTKVRQRGEMPEPNHIQDYFEAQAAVADEWKRRNWYYHKSVADLVRFFVPESRSVLEVGSGTGDLLAAVKPSHGVGIDFSDEMLRIARAKYSDLEWRKGNAEDFAVNEEFDYVLLSDLIGYVRDVEKVFYNLVPIGKRWTSVC